MITKVFAACTLIALVCPLAMAAEPRAAAPTSGEAQWIWSAANAAGRIPPGVCYFRKTFDLSNPESGRIAITCDDAYELFVNGRSVGAGTDWKKIDRYDITRFLVAGRNTIAVKAENVEPGTAALVARVTVKRAGNTDVSQSTDSSWKASNREAANWQKPAFNDAHWPAAHSFGEFGRTRPWHQGGAAASEASRFRLPAEFRVERVATPEATGSLIAMTFNEWGDAIVSREGGPLLLIRDENKDGAPETVSTFCAEMKNCQGMLALNGNLFAIGEGPEGTGFYKLADTDQDGSAESVQLLFKFKGAMAEHGPHAPVLGPDGMIYIMVGNHATLEKEPSPDSPLRNYYEGDLVQPRYEDAGGHAIGIKAPGGTVVRTDTEGSFVELYAGGLRNAYDMAFNRDGDLFTFDSDMEWDEGMTWYRPTRVNHIIPGAEFGWRSGWANWPEYFLDGLGPTISLGRGSPTGVEFYNHNVYPEKYHNALFLADWSRGRILALRLKREGGTYAATGEVFLQGQPLNVTDLAVGPDGWMYFVTGGRETEGGLYRVVLQKTTMPRPEPAGIQQAIRQPQLYSAWAREKIATVKEEMGETWDAEIQKIAGSSAAPSIDRMRALDLMQLFGPTPETSTLIKLSTNDDPLLRGKSADLMGLHADEATQTRLVELLDDLDSTVRRKACEALLRAGQTPPMDKLLALAADADRFVRWSARRSLEATPRDQWQELVLSSQDPRVFLEGSVALLTVNAEREVIDRILAHSGELMQGFINDDDFVDILRVIQLALYRGQVKGDEVPELRTQLSEEFPAFEPRLNRELIRILAYLQDASITERLLAELAGKSPLVEKVHLAAHARFLNTNWTLAQKLELLTFYEFAKSQPGGHSYPLYLDNLTRDYVALMSDAERRQVLAQAFRAPTAALYSLAMLPSEPGKDILEYLVKVDRRLKIVEGPSAKQLGTGILAVLGESRDPAAMAYLREVFETEPDRRQMVAMSLAQQPDAENWPLLLRALPVLEGAAAQEVIAKLAETDQRPDQPEPVRQLILCGLKLGETNHAQTLALLEKWTEEHPHQADQSWDVAMAAWQKWFAQKYPDQPEARLPQESAENRWTETQLLAYLTGPEASAADAVRGQHIFEKGQCIKCHRYDGRGESIGPDLTTVSQRFQKKEILESILFPSQVISDQYGSKTVETTDGLTYTGIVGAAGADGIVILQSSGEKKALAKDEIAEIFPNKKSAMPEGLFNNLTLEEIADLFAYLNKSPRSLVKRTRPESERPSEIQSRK